MHPQARITRAVLALVLIGIVIPLVESSSRAVMPLMPPAHFVAQDPGVRGGSAGAGAIFSGLDANSQAVIQNGADDFVRHQSVLGILPNTDPGLGPRFNGTSCGGCHIQPAVGGTSPASNPQIAMGQENGATNVPPFFLTPTGPIREARFKRHPDGSPDGGVHDLFTITGMSDAGGCFLQQPDFKAAAAQNNLIFRIPTPVFGAGLIEAIPDTTILANVVSGEHGKAEHGITGRANRSGNDGTVTRFGWKAQNKSLLIFAAEAYNVEMGITTDAFPQERDETASCQFNQTPENTNDITQPALINGLGDVEKFARFMENLVPPTPAPDTVSSVAGKQIFMTTGCAACHTPTLHTGNNSNPNLNNKDANLFSDLLLHNMGPGLADGIVQGLAQGDEFRTAPLWGVGQRVFFLHDGRTKDLREAILQHASGQGQGGELYRPSEAFSVIQKFNQLSEIDKQHLLDFLRTL